MGTISQSGLSALFKRRLFQTWGPTDLTSQGEVLSHSIHTGKGSSSITDGGLRENLSVWAISLHTGAVYPNSGFYSSAIVVEHFPAHIEMSHLSCAV